MTHSQQATEFIKQFEGFSPATYQDQRGIWTIGYGHTSGVKEGDLCTPTQATAWLNEDIGWVDSVLAHRCETIPLTQDQYDALTSFIYNIGSGSFESSTTYKRLLQHDYIGAANAMLLWNKIGNTVNAGLNRRRMAEHDMFMKGTTA